MVLNSFQLSHETSRFHDGIEGQLNLLGDCSEADILDQLTPRLRAEVIQVANNDSVKLLHGLPLFEELEESSLSKISVSLRSSFMPPDEVIFVSGEVGRQMYIIQKGVVAVCIHFSHLCVALPRWRYR